MGNTPRIGFVGLGFMGGPMAHRLLSRGIPVAVWARNTERLPAFRTAGAQICESPAALASASDIVMTCVYDTMAMEDLLFGAGRMVDGLGPGKTLVDFSSIRPEAARGFASLLRADSGTGMIDAPVSGGPPAAEAGTLVIMAGGEEADFHRVRPIVDDHLAARFTLMGASGAGQATKLVNQAFVGNLLAVLAEMARFSLNSGIDAARIPEALAGGRADSRLLQEFFPVMLDGEFPPTGAIKTIMKDLDAVLETAKENDAPIPMTALTAQLHRMMTARGHGDDDVTALYKLFGQSALPWTKSE